MPILCSCLCVVPGSSFQEKTSQEKNCAEAFSGYHRGELNTRWPGFVLIHDLCPYQNKSNAKLIEPDIDLMVQNKVVQNRKSSFHILIEFSFQICLVFESGIYTVGCVRGSGWYEESIWWRGQDTETYWRSGLECVVWQWRVVVEESDGDKNR